MLNGDTAHCLDGDMHNEAFSFFNAALLNHFFYGCAAFVLRR
jgi:hypothetical protein